jgi:hypothetical protein
MAKFVKEDTLNAKIQSWLEANGNEKPPSTEALIKFVKKAIYSVLSFFYFLYGYSFIFFTSYIAHFPAIHKVHFYTPQPRPDYFTEWCPLFPFSHNTPINQLAYLENFSLIMLGLSFITSIAFFYLNRKGRWILILAPIIIVIILFVILLIS